MVGQFSQTLKRWELRGPDLLTLRAPWSSMRTAACVCSSSSYSQSRVNVDNLRTSPSNRGIEIYMGTADMKVIDVEDAF